MKGESLLLKAMVLTEIKRQKGASYILQIPPLRLEKLAKPMVNISLSL
jgi:hypothetical protein